MAQAALSYLNLHVAREKLVTNASPLDYLFKRKAAEVKDGYALPVKPAIKKLPT